MSVYDSRPETYRHIQVVQRMLTAVACELLHRSNIHDQSKLHDPERAVFDEYTPKLRELTYGSDEYRAALAGMGEGLEHHYQMNPHHPEHHPHGIADMTLIDLTEMLADWKAATLRHEDGDMETSIRKNAKRFGYGGELENLLLNTARALGWVDEEE